MTLVDKEIVALIDKGVLVDADPQKVGSISYDLCSDYFSQKADDELKEFTLSPGESVFVACQECVHLPNNLCARIVLRNSRIREGFALTAPVYQPGHSTRLFFRLTNTTEKSIQLVSGSIYASIMFEELSQVPDAPYDGAFQSELRFSGMGEYHKEYKLDYSEIEEKAESIKHVEQNIYANVITLMTVFIALFSLINVNVELAYAETIATNRMIVFNLVTIGSIAFLVSLIRLSITRKPKADFWLLLLVTIAALVTAVIIAVP